MPATIEREEAAGAREKSAGGASYWRDSTRPLVSLAFVMPMLLIYEGGVLLLGQSAARNGIDVLLRWLLGWMGFGQYFLLPLLMAGILLAWHHMTGRPWRFRGALIPCMLLESLALGLILLLAAQLHGSLFTHTASVNATGASIEATLARVVAYFGAGIYEELLFRLMLLPVAIGLLKLCGLSSRWSLVAGLLLTSVIFSAAHYQMFTTVGDEFAWFSFIFRTLAGLFFSLLFLVRGFGIAVGAHALYDILVVLL